MPMILASTSTIRKTLLENAGLQVSIRSPLVDEEAIRRGMIAAGAKPRDVADQLAQAKAMKISGKTPGQLVLGCDQVLAHDGNIINKSDTRNEAEQVLKTLRNAKHQLFSAAVLCRDAKPIWRHVSTVHLRMRDFSDEYLKAYLDRNWSAVRSSVGCYHLEGEGARLFSEVRGDYFSVLGLPMIELLSYLTLANEIDG